MVPQPFLYRIWQGCAAHIYSSVVTVLTNTFHWCMLSAFLSGFCLERINQTFHVLKSGTATLFSAFWLNSLKRHVLHSIPNTSIVIQLCRTHYIFPQQRKTGRQLIQCYAVSFLYMENFTSFGSNQFVIYINQTSCFYVSRIESAKGLNEGVIIMFIVSVRVTTFFLFMLSIFACGTLHFGA